MADYFVQLILTKRRTVELPSCQVLSLAFFFSSSLISSVERLQSTSCLALSIVVESCAADTTVVVMAVSHCQQYSLRQDASAKATNDINNTCLISVKVTHLLQYPVHRPVVLL
ncbi:MAG: hypothetical protein K0R82_1646 [Flavipsychrobacter sp.]|nr:hypothetical protein [Flavipsychrobacter sp.]